MLNFDKSYFIDKAIMGGALNAVAFDIKDIVFDSRTIIKCMFGCSDWGKGHTCPSKPGALKPWEYKKVFEEYSWGIIIHANNKKTTQEISFSMEADAFSKGFYFAFSLSDCALCSTCAGFKGIDCINPQKARPAFHSVGIDVFKTVRNLNLPIDTLSVENQIQNWYSAVFIE